MANVHDTAPHLPPEPGHRPCGCNVVIQMCPCRSTRHWVCESHRHLGRCCYCGCECCHERHGGQGGEGGPCRGPVGRPTRPGGSQTGRINDQGPITTGDLNNPNPPGVWVGPRSQLWLPYLFMRANAGDLGARPVNGPFWESPDIFILAGVEPATAPDVPAQLGQIGLAGKPNTLYAHVWNLGNASADVVLVEFYWCDPALGINAASTHLIAQTATSLGPKGSANSHAVVKCPVAWVPTYLNGGHECLLVRVWDDPADLPGLPLFDASWNRHVAQRNIHVVAAANAKQQALQPGGVPAPGPVLTNPILINVGPLFGGTASVAVERVAPNTMPWLQLHTMQRGAFPAMAPPTGSPVLSPPSAIGGGTQLGSAASQQHVTGDDQQVAFSTSDTIPSAGESHVYRVTSTQDGSVFGGYTVVVLG
jgi:hypothetical protein